MSMQEDCDSSSDDSVCFGPYTIDEAKKDIKKCIPRKVDRRHSSMYRHFDVSKEIEKIAPQFEEATNVSSIPSGYFTSNEEEPREEASKNSDFLEKLSKAINEPVSASTLYNTACDQTNVQEVDASQSKALLDGSVISISDDDSSSSYEFVGEDFDEPSWEFNDTLDELNKFLEEADSSVQATTTPKLSIKDSPTKDLSHISGSFMNSSSHDFLELENKGPVVKMIKSDSASKKVCKFLHTESRIKPPSVIAKSLLFPKSNTESDFKLPSKPVKKLLTPCKVSNPALKNVVSPVGIYIRHAPKYYPMVNVSNKTQSIADSKCFQSSAHSSLKENIPKMTKIPPAIYKPAKTKFAMEVKDVNLPNSIKKLISPQVVTKHERRIEAETCNESVERRLLESDLSIDVSESSQEVANSDISILTHKQPFNLRRF